jgi:plastocyanin
MPLRITTLVLLIALLVVSASAHVVNVNVGEGGLVYNESTVRVNPGDAVVW